MKCIQHIGLFTLPWRQFNKYLPVGLRDYWDCDGLHGEVKIKQILPQRQAFVPLKVQVHALFSESAETNSSHSWNTQRGPEVFVLWAECEFVRWLKAKYSLLSAPGWRLVTRWQTYSLCSGRFSTAGPSGALQGPLKQDLGASYWVNMF